MLQMLRSRRHRHRPETKHSKHPRNKENKNGELCKSAGCYSWVSYSVGLGLSFGRSLTNGRLFGHRLSKGAGKEKLLASHGSHIVDEVRT